MHVADGGHASDGVQREERVAAVREDVRMHVPESRDQVLASGVDHARSRRDAHLTGPADLGDPIAGHDDGPVPLGGGPAGIHDNHVRKGHDLQLGVGTNP